MFRSKPESEAVPDESVDQIWEESWTSFLACLPAGLQKNPLGVENEAAAAQDAIEESRLSPTEGMVERHRRATTNKVMGGNTNRFADNNDSSTSMGRNRTLEGFSVEMTEESFMDEPLDSPKNHNDDDEEEEVDKVELAKKSLIDDSGDADEFDSFWQKRFRSMARNPKRFLICALLGTLVVAIVGLFAGEFSVTADNSGWTSRGTKIADQTTQGFLLVFNKEDLFSGDEEYWDDLINNVQPGWETLVADDDDSEQDNRRLFLSDSQEDGSSWREILEPKGSLLSERFAHEERSPTGNLPFIMSDMMTRRLQESNKSSLLEGCDLTWYDAVNMTQDSHVWAMWKTEKSTSTALDPVVLREICLSEERTQAYLVEQNLCLTCEGGGCNPPFGLVFIARLIVDNGFTLSCDELADAWAPYQNSTEEEWAPCVEELKIYFDPDAPLTSIPDSCPFGFYPTLLDFLFDTTLLVEYSSSIFATTDDIDLLFEKAPNFDRGSDVINAVYDTNYEHFVWRQTEKVLGEDMVLAALSAMATAIAILVHTRSPWLTVIGLFQIFLSIPIAFFVYTFVARLDFFPVLNFIGVFVVFALGADDIFVAVDKWKNVRIEHWDKSTEYVAALALPDAAGAMFLTTITTAVAFFGTAICPVAPVLCFAVYCGLLIIFDYVLCLLLVFPAMCIYDAKRHETNNFMRCHFCKKFEAAGLHGEETDEKPSLIRRILLRFYNVLHRCRWIMFAIIMGSFGVCAYYASSLGLPESSDVRLLRAEDYQYERHFEWKENLLYDYLVKKSGSQTYIVWGATPADTGNHLDPSEFSSLVLDETFDPSTEDAQVYMQGFCDDLFEQDFAEKIDPDYVCPMNEFDEWLQEQSQSDLPDDAYAENCGGATGLPVRPSNFDACVIAWSQQFDYVSVLPRGDTVKAMYVSFNSKIRYDSPYEQIDDEYKDISRWMDDQRKNVAPEEVGGFFFSSLDFWWYDTNGQMLTTTYGAAAIALVTAGVVILFSSHSVMLTLFAVFTIGFILVAVTACLVGLNWSLGFLEAICFAILIGISCDFVIHFAHSYAALPGMHSRDERTKHALLLMGPSILAGAFTTIAAAIIMLFTSITFFEKFATILFLTIILSTVGSFFVFITLTDCIGPTHPTFVVDLVVAECTRLYKTHCCKKEKSFLELTDDESGSNEEGDDSPRQGGDTNSKGDTNSNEGDDRVDNVT